MSERAPSRRRVPVPLVVVAVVGLLAVLLVVVTRPSTSGAERIASMPQKMFALDALSFSLRSSLLGPDGTTYETESAALLDLANDQTWVDLPDVVGPDALRLVSEGSQLYVTIPTELRDAFGGVRWLGTDVGSRAAARGAGVGPVPDPVSVFAALAGATGPTTSLPDAKLNGEQVTVRRVRVFAPDIAARLGSDFVASADAMSTVSHEWTAEAWIGEGGVPRRVVLWADLDASDLQPRRLTFDLLVAVPPNGITVGIPPADAVQPIASVDEALQLLNAV